MATAKVYFNWKKRVQIWCYALMPVLVSVPSRLNIDSLWKHSKNWISKLNIFFCCYVRIDILLSDGEEWQLIKRQKAFYKHFSSDSHTIQNNESVAWKLVLLRLSTFLVVLWLLNFLSIQSFDSVSNYWTWTFSTSTPR